MKNLAMVAVVAAAVCLAIGGFKVVSNGTVGLLTPNALLRLTDTALLFAIVVLLAAPAEKK